MDFLATHHKLPDPGGYVSSLPSRPCGCCPAAIFDVVRIRRVDGREAVEVECPNCKLLTHRWVASRRVIGSLNTKTGQLMLA